MVDVLKPARCIVTYGLNLGRTPAGYVYVLVSRRYLEALDALEDPLLKYGFAGVRVAVEEALLLASKPSNARFEERVPDMRRTLRLVGSAGERNGPGQCSSRGAVA